MFHYMRLSNYHLIKTICHFSHVIDGHIWIMRSMLCNDFFIIITMKYQSKSEITL